MGEFHSYSNEPTNVIPFHSPQKSISFDELLDEWLGQSRSPHTRRVYRASIKDFFRTMVGDDPTPLRLAEFLSLDQSEAQQWINEFRALLIEKNAAPATVNRKLAALSSLVAHARLVKKCRFVLNIKREKVKPYRDTKGIDKENFKKILCTCDRTTLKGKRDYAILLLLWGNALRRSEVVNTKIDHFDPDSRTLKIVGKGQADRETVTLGKETTAAICDWLEARGETDKNAPLFTSVAKSHWGHQLITHSLYKIVRERAIAAGIGKVVSPHRIRHSSITAALDATGGDVRRVQKLSRHANLDTLVIYDDNRLNHQGEVTELLESLSLPGKFQK